MTDRFDVVVAGAGHNSLIAAAYLAKAGYRCLVLEGRAVVTSMGPQNVDTVLIAGKVMKRNGQLVGVDFARLTRLGDEARDRIYANANVKNTRI